MGYRVAVVGATGNVGREMLQTLAERNFPADSVVALASARSAGQQISFGEHTVLKVQDLAKFDFKGIDIVLSSPGAKVSAEHSPRAVKAGAVVIDNTFLLAYGSRRAAGRAGSEQGRPSRDSGGAASSPIPTARPSRW
jgi:aspartate-semialdehyde dehydrogenase